MSAPNYLAGGQAAAMAVALHQESGLPICLIKRSTAGQPEVVLHIGAMVSDQLFLDVRGLLLLSPESIDGWDPAADKLIIAQTTVEKMAAWLEEDSLSASAVFAARRYVRRAPHIQEAMDQAQRILADTSNSVSP